MSETKILTPLGFFRGVNDGKIQYFQLQSEDKEGNLYVCTFGAKVYLTDTIEKYFNKLFPVAAPSEEVEVKEEINLNKEIILPEVVKLVKKSKSIFD